MTLLLFWNSVNRRKQLLARLKVSVKRSECSPDDYTFFLRCPTVENARYFRVRTSSR